jgi:NADH-quinone oxidoreductase subunit G
MNVTNTLNSLKNEIERSILMPQITLDGKLINVDNGKTIIEAAYQNDMQIPHFCWHPELSVSGNCRMCLVEVGMPKKLPDGSYEHDSQGIPAVQWFPKLQIACATQVTDGMIVRSVNEKVTSAQESVMEFLLINHPLDCPICDEAGECKLQEYAFLHSNGESRFEENKNHNDKRTEWGPNVLYDAERCISCSRCIRYSKEIAQQDVLTFVNRGDHVKISLFEGTSLDNPYSMNVIELCPVGALTSKDFRFQSRVWEMSFNDSICTGCSKGCNIEIGVKNNQALRIQPKNNQFVNKYWLCDYGRNTQYEPLNENRVNSNLIRQSDQLLEISFNEAKDLAIQKISHYKPNEIIILGSPFLTNEDNYILNKFAKNVLKTKNVDFIEKIDNSFADNFLKTNDKSPNARGAKVFGIQPFNESNPLTHVVEQLNKKHIKAMVIVNDLLDESDELFEAAKNLELLISIASNHSKFTSISDIVFAASTSAEIEGTFINSEERVQHFMPAIVTKENLPRMGMKMSRWDKFGAFNDNWTQKDIRESKPVWKILVSLANSLGGNFHYGTSEEIFNEICVNYTAFNGMSYELLAKNKGSKLNFAKVQEKISMNYISHSFKP